MNICEKISEVELCAVKMADNYVKAANVGATTDDMLTDLLLMNSYVDTLCNYEVHPKREVKRTFSLTDNGMALTDSGNILSLTQRSCEHVNPDDVNCLNRSEIHFILEQVQIKCNCI